MKLICLLPFTALSAAFVIPDEDVMSQIAIESHRTSDSIFDQPPTRKHITHKVESTFAHAVQSSKSILDQAITSAEETGHAVSQLCADTAFEAKSWLEQEYRSLGSHGGPEHGGPGHGHHGHHGPHGSKPNLTVYQLITESKYTTKLAALINEYEDIVELLNGTNANYTVFAPIDRAFEKIPEHHPKPSKEDLKNILLYHVSPDFYPAGRVLVTHTIPSSYVENALGGQLQRLSINVGLRGLTVNFYNRVIAINIFGTNGVIHGVENILVPPPKAVDIIQFLPGEFSTFELGLTKTGLLEAVNNTSTHLGGTLFAPSNIAFQLLGPKINAFLFSSYGLKYLKALLKYHIVPNRTLYSDAFYTAEPGEAADIPKGLYHVDLPTWLKGKSLSVDIARFGGFISIKINGFSTVTIEDGIAKDGVIHVLSNVLIPPKQFFGAAQLWRGEELTEEELMERLDPYVAKDNL